MASEIAEHVAAAIRVAREDHGLLRIGQTAQKIAATVGRPDRADFIADVLLRACVEHRVTIEIERGRSPERGGWRRPIGEIDGRA